MFETVLLSVFLGADERTFSSLERAQILDRSQWDARERPSLSQIPGSDGEKKLGRAEGEFFFHGGPGKRPRDGSIYFEGV